MDLPGVPPAVRSGWAGPHVLARKVVSAGGKGSKWYHVVNVESVDDIDEQLLDWLTEAYAASEP